MAKGRSAWNAFNPGSRVMAQFQDWRQTRPELVLGPSAFWGIIQKLG
jgi:hypothetical protein